LPSAKRKVVEIIVKVIPKKPRRLKGQSGGLIDRKSRSEYPIKRKKSQVQQHMEEELEQEIQRLEKEKRHKP
jgi:hypothetical protein